MVAQPANKFLAGLAETDNSPASATATAIIATVTLAPAPTLKPVDPNRTKECVESEDPKIIVQPPGQCAVLAYGQRQDANRSDHRVTGNDLFEPCCKNAYAIEGSTALVGCFCKGTDCKNTTECFEHNREAMYIGVVACTPPETKDSKNCSSSGGSRLVVGGGLDFGASEVGAGKMVMLGLLVSVASGMVLC